MPSLSRAGSAVGVRSRSQLGPAIHWPRLALAVALTFVVADTYPHPRLAPGVMAQGLAWLRHAPETPMLPALNALSQPTHPPAP